MTPEVYEVTRPVGPSAATREQRIAVGLRIAEVLQALVQPVIALLFSFAIVWMAITGAITSGEFLGVAAVAIGFFFQSRQSDKAQQRLDATQQEAIQLALQTPPQPRS